MDKRIKKTRQNILSVFLTLLEEKPVGEITAQEIAERADISRSTFYRHYTDVYDLLDQAEGAIFQEIYDLLEGYPYEVIRKDPLRLFTELVHYFGRNAKISVVLISQNGSVTTGQRIGRMIEGKLQQEWAAVLRCKDETQARYLSQYIISGFVGMLQDWIAGGMREPAEEMALTARSFIDHSVMYRNTAQHQKEETVKMSDYKDKIREDAKNFAQEAKGFAGGVFSDTSALLTEKSSDLQKKVEAGLGMASSKLIQTGNNLRTGFSQTADDWERQREKLLKKLAELERKFEEKIATLIKEGNAAKAEQEREKYEQEKETLQEKILELGPAGETD